MARNFPALGGADFDMHGMFIGERHDNPEHFNQLLENWPTLSASISVLFLEHYFAGDSPSGQSVQQIRQYLTARNFLQTAVLPHQIKTLTILARHSSTEIMGLDVSRAAAGAPVYNPINWRTSQLLQEMWISAVNQAMLRYPSKPHYAIYGGGAHGPMLRRYGLRNIICYTRDGEAYREYTAWNLAGGVTWAP
ncbi:MAG TPA: hypothetical protein PLR99_02285 [Polyangiaceae bacterium]|nr:hypothetical protein [Polyangiaceae bacterium]